MSRTHPRKAVKAGWGAKILRLGGNRESPTRDVRAWRDGTQETLRPRALGSHRDTKHMLTREHTDSSPGHTPTAHAEALAFRGRKATAHSRTAAGARRPLPAAPLQRLAQQAAARAGARSALPPPRPAGPRELAGAGRAPGRRESGKGCVPAVCGFRKAGAGRARGGAAAPIKSPAARA